LDHVKKDAVDEGKKQQSKTAPKPQAAETRPAPSLASFAAAIAATSSSSTSSASRPDAVELTEEEPKGKRRASNLQDGFDGWYEGEALDVQQGYMPELAEAPSSNNEHTKDEEKQRWDDAQVASAAAAKTPRRKSKKGRNEVRKTSMTLVCLDALVYDHSLVSVSRSRQYPRLIRSAKPFSRKRSGFELAPPMATSKVASWSEEVTHPFVGWDIVSCIFKGGDDCRQEVLAMQLIILFDEAFKDAHLPLRLRPYRSSQAFSGRTLHGHLL
jgi:hypothetical protein